MKKTKMFVLLLALTCLVANNSYAAWALFWKRTTPKACPEGQKPPCSIVEWCIFCEVPPADNSTSRVEIEKTTVIKRGKDFANVQLSVSDKSVSKELIEALKMSNNSSTIDGGIISEKMAKELGLNKEFIGKIIESGPVVCDAKPRKKRWPVITITIKITWPK